MLTKKKENYSPSNIVKEYNIDFHIHSREGGGTSPNMTIPLDFVNVFLF